MFFCSEIIVKTLQNLCMDLLSLKNESFKIRNWEDVSHKKNVMKYANNS